MPRRVLLIILVLFGMMAQPLPALSSLPVQAAYTQPRAAPSFTAAPNVPIFQAGHRSTATAGANAGAPVGSTATTGTNSGASLDNTATAGVDSGASLGRHGAQTAVTSATPIATLGQAGNDTPGAQETGTAHVTATVPGSETPTSDQAASSTTPMLKGIPTRSLDTPTSPAAT